MLHLEEHKPREKMKFPTHQQVFLSRESTVIRHLELLNILHRLYFLIIAMQGRCYYDFYFTKMKTEVK
jgi:hypothetical protein